jgi:predicted ArsR family transcriptional regulator
VCEPVSEQVKVPQWQSLITDPIRFGVLRILSEIGEASAVQLAARSNVSEPTIRRHLEQLVKMGWVRECRGESDGLTPGRPATRFSLEPEAREGLAVLLEALARVPQPAPARTGAPARLR